VTEAYVIAHFRHAMQARGDFASHAGRGDQARSEIASSGSRVGTESLAAAFGRRAGSLIKNSPPFGGVVTPEICSIRRRMDGVDLDHGFSTAPQSHLLGGARADI